jgi:uncharacterized protein (TIGR00725 family)
VQRSRPETTRRRILGVIGPGEDARPQDVADASEVAALAAQAGWVVLTGGRHVGVMDAASRGARSVNGLTIGILPDRDPSSASEAVQLAIVTGLGEVRNQIIVLSSDAIVVCGMSAGTAVEASLALKAGKHVVFVRPEPGVRAFFERLGGSFVRTVEAPAQALAVVTASL